MKFSDLPGQPFSVRVLATDRIALSDLLSDADGTAAVRAIDPSITPGEFGLTLRDDDILVRPVDGAEARRLNDELLYGRAMLAQLSDLGDDGSAALSVRFFTGHVLELGDVELGIDEYVINGARRLGLRSARRAPDWLREGFVYDGDGRDAFFVSIGPVIESVLTETAQEGAATSAGPGLAGSSDEPVELQVAELREAALAPKAEQTTKNSFLMIGADARFVATDTPVGSGQSIYVATKLAARTVAPDPAVRLARGRVTFVDWSAAGQIQVRSRAQLASLTQDESSYLRKWDEFGELEGELLLDQARALGVIRFTAPREEREGTVTVQVTDAPESAFEALRRGAVEAVDLVDVEPSYLANPAQTFAEFSRQITLDAGLSDRPRQVRDAASQTTVHVVRFDNASRRLELQVERLPPEGILVQSLQGEIAQIRRRHAARRAIIEGRSANPQLGLLMEEKGEVTSLRSPQKVRPLTAFVRAKVFRNAPTAMQEKAIEVALNTPDIALIQGPPGTGKTTVIAAILERLNEDASRAGRPLKGRVLLTGFQHDAVENMIDRISLNSIPVPKFGKRTGAVDGATMFERNLEAWCSQIARELRDRNPEFADIEHEAEIRDLYQQYLQGPSRRLGLTLVGRIAALDLTVLGEQLMRSATRLLQRLTAEDSTTASEPAAGPLAAARRLRVLPESFADDGPERAEEALVDLEPLLSAEERRVLDGASLWTRSRGVPPFLAELGGVKKSLLKRLTAPPEFRVEKPSDEVLGLGRDVLDRLRTRGRAASDRKSAALAQFLAELETDPWGMVDAVAEYSYAFAATVQQSVNTEMQRRKGLSSDGSENLEYDYVIIDEAARVSPRDLMIPMSQGKRIILVGDHRQLPHLIDEAVAQGMESGEAGPSEGDWLKRSMFEYLFAERLKALEAGDGIVRRVTLDRQFRMHPVLGEFISRNFYERFDPSERFDSGLPRQQFVHDLPGTQARPAIWLTVGSDEGPSRRSDTSWTRQAEADGIVERLSDWIRSPEGERLTYGVISFYKAQAELIRHQLRQRIGDLADDERRIRVGTVDSFQGMEFDVVFLSVVRTVPTNWTPRNADPSLNARGLFGHLCLYNRLNVSMSRQKRLLVVVGDPAIVQHDLAADHIPGLVDFYRLAHAATPAPRALTGTRAMTRSPIATAGQDPVAPSETPTEPQPAGLLERLLGRGRSDA